MTGAFGLTAFMLLLTAPGAVGADVVDVGDGELDDALYGNGAEVISIDKFIPGVKGSVPVGSYDW